jgi:hypothetical protein
MDIKLTPMRMDERLFLHRSGDTVILNDVVYDFSSLEEGDQLDDRALGSIWFVGPIGRENGELYMCIRLPNPVDYTQEQAFPKPLYDVQDGPVKLPGWATRELGKEPETAIINWAYLSKKVDRDRAAAIPVELTWQNHEMAFIANQLLALEEEAYDALPGTRREWLSYRTLVRLWHDNKDFPDSTKRPVRPT